MFLRHVPLLMVAGLLSACQTGPYVSAGLPYGAAADVANTPVPVYGAATCVPGCTGGVPVAVRPAHGDALQSALAVGGGAAPWGVMPVAGPAAGMVFPADNLPGVDDDSRRNETSGPAPWVHHRTARTVTAGTTYPAPDPVPATREAMPPAPTAGTAPFRAQPRSKDPAVNAALAPVPVTAVYGRTATSPGAGPTVPDPLATAPARLKKTDPARFVGVPLPDGSVPFRPGTGSASGATPGCKEMPDRSCRTIVPAPAN